MGSPWDPSDAMADAMFEHLPSAWQEDGWVQTLWTELVATDNTWDQTQDWYHLIHDYIEDQYGADFDEYFDWEEWYDMYDAA